MNHPSNRKPSRAGSGEGRFTLPYGAETCWSAGVGLPPPVSKRAVNADPGSAARASGWPTVYLRLLVNGLPSCLPVMRMAACPGWRAGMTARQALFFAVRLSSWPSRLAVSRMDACVVSSRAGLPGWPCPSRLHVSMPPCLLMAAIPPPMLAARTYCWLPSSARLGASPGFQTQTRPLESTNAACVASLLIAATAEWSGIISNSGWVCPLSR